MFRKALIKTRNGWRLPLREKVWLILLYPYSAIIRVSIYFFPFKQFSRVLGSHYHNHTLSTVVTKQQHLLALRIGKVVELAARTAPWKATCLVQAAMARTLLSYYDIPYVLHLGACMTPQETNSMKAHAWIKVGARVIVGGGGTHKYGIVSTFISPSLKTHYAYKA